MIYRGRKDNESGWGNSDFLRLVSVKNGQYKVFIIRDTDKYHNMTGKTIEYDKLRFNDLFEPFTGIFAHSLGAFYV